MYQLKHKLPIIKDLVLKDYLFIEVHPNDSNRDLLQDLQNQRSKIIFYKEETHLHYMYSELDQSQINCSDLPWCKTVSISHEESYENVIHLLSENEVILVEDSDGQHIGYLNFSILLQKLFESYQYLDAYFNTLIQTTDASISIIDEQCKTVVWTKGAEQIFSINKKEILGKDMTDYFPIEMLQVVETLKTGENVYRLHHQPRPDLFVLINSNPIKINNKIVGAVAAETDITSQVRLNQELFLATTKVQHLEQEMAKLKPSPDPFHNIKGTSQIIKETKDKIKKVGATKATTLIYGESGVGKELFAKAIHDISEAENAPFVPINCGAIPSSLFESELFGYEKGAFSGADHKGKKGKVELAKGGTLFLDEIGELPQEVQVKLLRLLQEKKYFPVGGTKQLEADIRVIAATNKNLDDLVKRGEFREDLYYRLNVVTIEIPPLRERKEDIFELTHYFLYEFSIRYNKAIKSIPHNLMQKILNYHWPGNIRELRNTIERLVVFATDNKINIEDLPYPITSVTTSYEQNLELTTTLHSATLDSGEQKDILSLQDELDSYEKRVIQKALQLEGGNKLSTAKRLGISRATLYNKMNKLNMQV